VRPRPRRQPTPDGFLPVIDTREQLPYEFPCPCAHHALPAGDYSIVGLEHLVAVERKRPMELFSCFTSTRDRFRREFELLSDFRYASVIVEGDITSCATTPCSWSSVSPHVVINSLIAWSIRYHVHVWFANDRTMAQALCYRILEHFWRQHGLESHSRTSPA